MFATKFGVSAENVVATIEIPKSHHGIFLPDRKYSLLFLEDVLEEISPIIMKTIKNNIIIDQSSRCIFISFDYVL